MKAPHLFFAMMYHLSGMFFYLVEIYKEPK